MSVTHNLAGTVIGSYNRRSQMVGGRIVFSKFDATSKGGWFGADMNGFFLVYLLTTLGFIMLLVIGGVITGVDTSQWISHAGVFAAEFVGDHAAFAMLFVLSAVPAFVLVFVLRINPTVIGQRREFRYLCRWL